MNTTNYGKVEDKVPECPEPPPYSEIDSLRPPDPQASAGPSGPIGYAAAPPVPNQYQPGYGAPETGFKQGPALQPPQTVFITAAQPTHEPDYLAYSIFTMICCFLPLGIAALVFSIQTREANFAGNLTAAQRNSRMARIMAHTAVGIGLGLLILYIVMIVLLTLM